jgi:hypothetical protein
MSNVGHQQNSRVLGHRWHQAVPFAGLHLSAWQAVPHLEGLAARRPSVPTFCTPGLASFSAFVGRSLPASCLALQSLPA